MPNLQVEVGKTAVVDEITRTFLILQQLQDSTSKDQVLQQIETAVGKVEKLSDDAVATLFSVIPESQLPGVSIGKRCQDEKKETFVVLGFRSSNKEKQDFDTDLHIYPAKETLVQGLILKEGK